MKTRVVCTRNAIETEEIGKKFSKNVKPGDVILLDAELGGGKTTFTKGLVRGLGFTNRVISPTFTLIRTYSKKIKNQKSKINNISIVYHVDLYRLKNKKDLRSLDLKEMLENPEAITIIEWPSLLRNLKIKNKISEIKFEYADSNTRQLTING